MSKSLLLFVLNYYLLLKISHAQYSNRVWPNSLPPNANAPILPTPNANMPIAPPLPTRPNALTTPNCYSDKATVYFIPAPPSTPTITVLNPTDGVPNLSTSVREVTPKQEVPTSLALPPPTQLSSRTAFPPPPPCFNGLPDLIDEIPSIIQDRFCRLAETDEKTTACECESCAKLIKNLPIFNFNQELLDGFLAGIGI